MTLFSWLFSRRRQPSPGIAAATKAIEHNDRLLRKMQEDSRSNVPARALMADIWAQRHNVPFMTTMYESAREMKDATQYSGSNQSDGAKQS